MKVHVVHTLRDFEGDQRDVAVKATRDMRDVVADNLRAGNDLARSSARRTAGAHGKHYHRAFDWEMTGLTQGEYGPDANMPQGGMSFERGSRNQPPHLDLAKSADAVRLRFAADAARLPDRWFW